MPSPTLYAVCESIYEYAGQDGVLSFANWLESEKHETFDWRTCEPCDHVSPHIHEDGQRVCLVCGTTTDY